MTFNVGRDTKRVELDQSLTNPLSSLVSCRADTQLYQQDSPDLRIRDRQIGSTKSTYEVIANLRNRRR